MKVEKQYIDFLKHIALFSPLKEEQLCYILEKAKITRLKKGDMLCKKGDFPLYFYIIVNGNVTEIVTDNNDFSTSLRIEGRYDYFGELGILLNEGNSSTVIAVTDIEVLCIHKEIFYDLTWGSQDMLALIIHTLKDRLQTAGQKEIAYTQMNAESRLAYVLLSIYNKTTVNNLSMLRLNFH